MSGCDNTHVTYCLSKHVSLAEFTHVITPIHTFPDVNLVTVVLVQNVKNASIHMEITFKR